MDINIRRIAKRLAIGARWLAKEAAIGAGVLTLVFAGVPALMWLAGSDNETILAVIIPLAVIVGVYLIFEGAAAIFGWSLILAGDALVAVAKCIGRRIG